MPEASARSVRQSSDPDPELRLVADYSRVAVEPDIDGTWLPGHVVDLAGSDCAEILRLRKGAAQWVDQLEVVRVQTTGERHILSHQRTQTLTLNRSQLFRQVRLAW